MVLYIIIIFRSFICNYDLVMWLRGNTRDSHSVITLSFPIVCEINAGLEFHFQFPRIFLFVVLTNVKWRFNKERKKEIYKWPTYKI